MPSRWGAMHERPCEACGLSYDKLRTGMSFTDVRNLIIAIQVDRKTGKTKYGRRNGVLGFWHELKRQQWQQHVGLCEGAMYEALSREAR
jgi:hypothetical protein